LPFVAFDTCRVYTQFSTRQWNVISQIVYIHLLDDHTRSRTAAITDRSNAVLALLELIQQRRQDSRAGAAECVTDGNGSSADIDFLDRNVEDLIKLD
jgi:hypothetical protein